MIQATPGPRRLAVGNSAWRALAALAVAALVAGTAPGAAAVTNDPAWLNGHQWGIAAVRAEGAWPHSHGAGVRIAVVDTGVDYDHEDLRGKVDLGWDFLDGDADPRDGSGHGTFVAGIAAAVTNNGRGIAGVAPHARILAIRALSNEGTPSSVITRAVEWAADQGADVINLSLGSPSPLPQAYALVPGLDNAVFYAWLRGSLVVAAAGNDALPMCTAPAISLFALCVGASTRNDTVWQKSNHGLRIDLVAPGADIVSTAYDPVLRRHDLYGSGSGTSLAAPHVSGAAALLMAMGATNVEAAAYLRCSATDLGDPGYDLDSGFGRLDAERAVTAYHQRRC